MEIAPPISPVEHYLHIKERLWLIIFVLMSPLLQTSVKYNKAGLNLMACLLILIQVVIQGSDDIASRAIDLLKEIYTNLGPKLQVNQVQRSLQTGTCLYNGEWLSRCLHLFLLPSG